jgi:hypothetical protein
MNRTFASVLAGAGLALSMVTLQARPAAADGTIYAVVYLTNNTSGPIQISQPSAGGVWGTEGDTAQSYAAS